MAPPKKTIRTYSPEELRLLAAEGRLKGRGIERLTRLQSHTGYNRSVSLSVFEKQMMRQPCWTDAKTLLHTFLDLTKIYSPSRKEKQVAAYITDRLKSLDITDIDRDAYGNIIANLPATDPDATSLLFTAHMDCVYPGGKKPVKLVLTEAGEVKTYGGNSLGADDKASIAAILTTLAYIQNAHLPHGEIRIVFTVQEELGYRGIKQVPASILNGIHLVISMDPPVRVERDETAKMAVLHMPPAHPFVHLVKESARDCGFDPLILFDEDGYVGGDTICLSPLGALVVDFCSTSRYAHTQNEHVCISDLITQTNWMIATIERALNFDPTHLDLRTVYGGEPIGALTGVRKQVPLTQNLLNDKRILAQTLHRRPGPQQVPVLVHLSTLAPRIGDPDLLRDVVETYTRCIRLDQVPQVLRDLTLALSHLATNLAYVRPLEPLIDIAHEVIQRGGDDHARINALNFLSELYQKSRRVAVKNRLLNIAILSLQSTSEEVVEATTQFLRANLDEAIHPLTVAFCNQTSWERMLSDRGRIVGGRSRNRETATRWTIIRQRILQLLMEEDRILPEMLEWIFSNDDSAIQKIAIGFIDPDKATHIADRILPNLKSRRAGVQETAVHFVGTHRMVRAIDPLVDLLLTPYLCRNRSLVEWALDSIGAPALDTVVTRLGIDDEYAPFVRRLFNRHDRSTDTDFAALPSKLQTSYGVGFALDDPEQLPVLGHYLGNPELTDLNALSHWDKRRTIIFYDHIVRIYPQRAEFDRLVELIEEADPQTRGRFAHMAIQKNIFADPDFLALVSRENARFLEHLAMLETHIPLKAVLSCLREFTSGAQLDIADPRDVEIYYLHLLKQSPQIPDRTRYLQHIQEAKNRLFPQLKPYCKAFTIAGDRIEEVGTVDRERIRELIDSLPSPGNREERLRDVFALKHLAKRERNRLINSLAEAFNIEVTPFSTVDDRIEAIIERIDFEFDAAYRTVPQVVFPLLMCVRMKHRNKAVVKPMAEYAIEYALISHPEIRDSFDTGETDLLLDSLNDLLTDRVYEAEGELAEDVFQELKDKHVNALAQFYTSNWKGIIRDLKKQFTSERETNLITATEQAMLEYDVKDEEDSDLLDTNLNRLIQVLYSPVIEQARRESNISEADGAKLLDTNFSRLMHVLKIQGADLAAFHDRHREFFKLYTATLRVRNLRQFKRIYREVYLILQDKLSFAGREHVSQGEKKRLATCIPEEDQSAELPELPGYLKYTRKELGKLSKLMSDFVIENALDDRVDTVQHEITKLRQVVIGTSQILCAPSKDVSIIYRSWPGNDCNQGDIKQILSPDCSFYKIISDGLWKGYFTLVELQRRNKQGISQRAFLLDVLNFSGLKMENESFIKVLMHQVIQIAQTEGVDYVLTGPREEHISNRDYIRRAFRKAFPADGTEQGFGLINTPTANFQSLNPNLTVAWKSPKAA